MKQKGQVFTLDMFLALAIISLVVSYSGLALEQARRQAETYVLRHSLEQTANDAAEVLVKTSGTPENWEADINGLETPGLTESERGHPLNNTLSIIKLGWLRDLLRYDNWQAYQNENAVGAVRALFGGSDNFEINIYGADGGVWWSMWPGWDVESSSGSENSLEVAVVKRPVVVRSGAGMRSEAKGLQHLTAGPSGQYYTLDFLVNRGELDVFDWYVLLRPSGSTNPSVKLWVNRTTGSPDFSFPPALDNNIYKMRYHGADYTAVPLTDADNGGNPNNYMRVKVTGNPSEWVDVFVVFLPRCSPSELAASAPDNVIATLEVRLWR